MMQILVRLRLRPMIERIYHAFMMECISVTSLFSTMDEHGQYVSIVRKRLKVHKRVLEISKAIIERIIHKVTVNSKLTSTVSKNGKPPQNSKQQLSHHLHQEKM